MNLKMAKPTRTWAVKMRFVLLALLGGYISVFAVPSQAAFYNIITVDTSADDYTPNGNCTLREAIISANSNTGIDACAPGSATLTDEIVFAASTNGNPIVLTRVGAGDDTAATGDLDILYNVSNTNNEIYILGNGASSTIIDGDLGDRVFDVLSNASLILEKLTVTRGAGVSNGAGIFAEQSSSLSLNSVVVTNNIATAPATTARGGGIEADGTLYINTSFVVGNKAESTGGGNALGGGLVLYSLGTKSINLSVISNNVAKSSATTGGLAQGAGIFSSPSTASLSVTDSILDSNLSTTSTGAALGGAIHVDAGSLSLTRVQLTNNTAEFTAAGGTANGGAISSRYGVTLINSTLAGNQADYGAGLYLYSSNGIATLHGGTIAQNRSGGAAGGVYVVSGAVLNLYGTILAGNTAAGSAPDCGDAAGSGQVNANGYNLIGESDGCTINVNASTDKIGTAANPIDPMLGTLQTVPGAPTPTQVLPLQPGSPAIDAGDPILVSSGGSCESPDQVGDSRPLDDNNDGTAACDIGAVEYVLPATSSGGSGSGGGGGGGDISLPTLGLLFLLALYSRRSQLGLRRKA